MVNLGVIVLPKNHNIISALTGSSAFTFNVTANGTNYNYTIDKTNYTVGDTYIMATVHQTTSS